MQQLTDYLRDYSPKLEKFVREYFTIQKHYTKDIDPFLTDCLNYLETYLLGGKKIRGALAILGYQINNLLDVDKVLPVSAAIELIHSGLLIQDDFIDSDSMRHGIKSIHKLYAARKNPHFGASMAVIIGDLGYFHGLKIITNSNFKSELIVKILSELSHRLVNTGYGEILDVIGGNPDIVRLYKTAHYSFVMPLSVGAILAGAAKPQLQAIEKYGAEVGLAFQMQDDILGVVGDPKVTGKSNSSDITGKKQTHILQKTRELIGHDFTNESPDEIRKIMQNSGAIDACKKLAQEHADLAKSHISQITPIPHISLILSQLADFVVLRNK